jgi:hypothetical protein
VLPRLVRNASGGFLARNLLAFRASLRESDRNRLLLAFHGLAASAALERAGLAALHGALHVVGRGLGVSSHGVSPLGTSKTSIPWRKFREDIH